MVTIGIKQTAKEVEKLTNVEGENLTTKEGIREIVEVTEKETIKNKISSGKFCWKPRR